MISIKFWILCRPSNSIRLAPFLSAKGCRWYFSFTTSGVFHSHGKHPNVPYFWREGKVVNDFEHISVSVKHHRPLHFHWTFKWTYTNDRAYMSWLDEIFNWNSPSNHGLQSCSCIIWFNVSIFMNMNLIGNTATAAIRKRQLWMSSPFNCQRSSLWTISVILLWKFGAYAR